MKRIHSVLQGPNPPEILTSPLTEKTLPDCSTFNYPSGHLKLVEIPTATVLFLIKTWLIHSLTHSVTQLLTHSLTHSLTCLLAYSLTHLLAWKGWRKTVITVVSPKQKIVVFINSYNFNFAAFILLI